MESWTENRNLWNIEKCRQEENYSKGRGVEMNNEIISWLVAQSTRIWVIKTIIFVKILSIRCVPFSETSLDASNSKEDLQSVPYKEYVVGIFYIEK